MDQNIEKMVDACWWLNVEAMIDGWLHLLSTIPKPKSRNLLVGHSDGRGKIVCAKVGISLRYMMSTPIVIIYILSTISTGTRDEFMSRN